MMGVRRIAARGRDLVRGAYRKARTAASRVDLPGPLRLSVLNRVLLSRVGGGTGPVVSLTTYGMRTAWSHLAIESIARGSLRPSRLILWLDEPATFAKPPAALRRLRRRGLEIRLAENFGPHTKYYPYLESTAAIAHPLVTADDDTIYPRWWLERLVSEHERTPDQVVCYRAREIEVTGEKLAPYATWEFSERAEPSFLTFPTAVSGIIHSPAFLKILQQRGRDFRETAAAADDVWIHHTAVHHGVRIRLVDGVSRTFPLIDETQEVALWYDNLTGGGNDQQIAATYSAEDIAKIVAQAASAR
nr:hypothetical protein [Microbacterium lemovicicum]